MDIRSSFLGLAVLALSATASAQDRAGSWEMGFIVSDTSSEALAGGSGSSLSVEGDLGWGFTTNYNITNRLAIGGDFIWSNPDYQAKRVLDNGSTQTINAELDVATLHLKGTFYLTEGALAPYIEAGGGWTAVDSNIVSGPPTTAAGGIRGGLHLHVVLRHHSETRTSWTYGVGLRWELSDEFVVRGSYGLLEIDAGNSEDAEMEVLRVDFGWRF
jgi:opacity protein-like surface antigen